MASISKYIEITIPKLLKELYNVYINIQSLEESQSMTANYNSEEATLLLQNEIDYNKEVFKFTAEKIYRSGLAYFETNKLLKYRAEFKKEINSYLIDDKKLYSGKYLDELAETYSYLIETFWKYFSPFPTIENNSKSINELGLIYLEHILESTAVILKDLGKDPQSEPEIYKGVRIVTNAVFADAISPSQSFQKTAKCYIPDILIPGLSCAVEYKYAITLKIINRTMDEILIDVKGYDKNPSYKYFYAVFYTKPGICSRKKFQKLWDEKEFPKNWKSIFVEGV